MAGAEPLELDPKLGAAAAFERIGRHCVEQIRRNETAALAGDPEGVHQMRVGSRRLRAAMSAFRKLLPDDQRRWASRELKWLADTLGEARNLDVFKTALLNPARATIQDKEVFRVLAEAVDRRQRAAYSAIEIAIGSPRYGTLILGLLRWFDGRSWSDHGAVPELLLPISEVAPSMLDRCYRLLKRQAKGFADQSPAQQHELRIALKKLRYTAELFGSLFPARSVEELSKVIKPLQDDLGSINDVHIGEALLDELAKASEPSAGIVASSRSVMEWHKDRLREKAKKIRKRLRLLRKAHPFWRS